MNPVKLFKLYRLYEKAQSILKEKAPMKIKIPQLVHLLLSLAALFGGASALQHYFGEHASTAQLVTQIVVGLLIVGHALAPSIVPDASDAAKKAAGLGAILLVLLLLPAGLHAQTTVPEGTLPANIYAIGPSYNPSATPQIAGSAFYGRRLADNTYGFTELDALPEPVKPFTVSTNVGMGVAQKLVTFRNVPIYGAMGTGIHWTGSATDWQWNGGFLAAIPLKKACATCYLMPNARFLSVGGGQYRPILGFWFGFGQ